MKRKFTKLSGALLALLMVPSVAQAEWRDIKVDLTNKNLLSDEEKAGMSAEPATFTQWSWVNGGDYIGIAVDELGNVSRVDKNDASAVCKIKGKWHSDNYGWASLEIIVPVEGSVKVSYGLGDFSNEVTIKDASDNEVKFNSNGTTWTSDHPERIASGYYTGGATTLSITGGSYQTYFAIESTAYVPNNKTVTFSLGDVTGVTGVVPTAVTKDIKVETTFKIPANYSLYKEDYTLTGWTDGVNTYAPGDTYTISDDAILTPIFEVNTVSLNDRTAATTIHWEFTKNQGVPQIGFEGNTGFLVGQANINGVLLDVKMAIDAISGKFNNSNGDWAQVKNPTYFTVPICDGATFVTSTMSNSAKATFDGVEDGTNNGYNLEYTYSGDGSSMVVGLGAASWYKYIEVTYPAQPTRTISIGSLLHATYYNNVAYQLPENMQAATVDGETSGTLTLNWRYAAGDVVPAGTPVILKATTSNNYTLTMKPEDTAAAPTGNYLYGSDVAVMTTGGGSGAKYYALQDGANGLGFYWMTAEGAAFTSGAHKAWLALPSATPAPFFALFDNMQTTGLNDVRGKMADVRGDFFDLQGRKVANPTKGLYIVNGKKVMVK